MNERRYMQYTLYAALGAVAGVAAGVFGIGGAVIIIPALVFFFGFSQHAAQGTSLAMLLPPIGVLAAYRYWQDGNVKIGIALIMAVAFMIGAYGGAQVAEHIPAPLMKKIFGGGLTCIGLFMIFGTK
jgi:uncharacterized protein